MSSEIKERINAVSNIATVAWYASESSDIDGSVFASVFEYIVTTLSSLADEK